MIHSKAARLVASLIFALVFVLTGIGCNKDDSVEPATYRLDFDTTWSAATHPTDFPISPHFSGLIGVTHGTSMNVWRDEQLASEGIKSMAETGSKSDLADEISMIISMGFAGVKISGGGIEISPGFVSVTFDVSEDYPVVSVVSMIAPSPDWFVGVSGLSLLSKGAWQEEVVVDLYPYDAGTDSGTTYTSANSVTDPPEVISQITGAPFTNGATVQKLGTFTFTKL
jgi:hypothetical protein